MEDFCYRLAVAESQLDAANLELQRATQQLNAARSALGLQPRCSEQAIGVQQQNDVDFPTRLMLVESCTVAVQSLVDAVRQEMSTVSLELVESENSGSSASSISAEEIRTLCRIVPSGTVHRGLQNCCLAISLAKGIALASGRITPSMEEIDRWVQIAGCKGKPVDLYCDPVLRRIQCELSKMGIALFVYCRKDSCSSWWSLPMPYRPSECPTVRLLYTGNGMSGHYDVLVPDC